MTPDLLSDVVACSPADVPPLLVALEAAGFAAVSLPVACNSWGVVIAELFRSPPKSADVALNWPA
jgi:hypothetical protein